ncbi:MAG: CoA transferase [actinobacterium acAMD-2]|nr:MAG: CoA transferase [actinobacterium acAMD-2]
MTHPGPLSDLRVVEMGQLLAGPFAGQLFADFGAELIKLEPPNQGDPLRVWGKERTNGKALWWSVLGRNKKSVTCNLRLPEGQQIARDIIATSDVLIENFRSGTLERWGLSPEQLWEINPRLVILRVTGFGQTGPMSKEAGYGAVGEAMGGLRYVTGDPDRMPSRAGISIGDTLAATFGTLGALMALHARNRTGRGQVVDSALYEAVLAVMESLVIDYDQAGFIRERTGSILPKIAPSNVYPTQDGEMLIAGNGDSIFRRMAEGMGQPELADDPRFADHTARGENQAELDAVIEAWSLTKTSEEVDALMTEHKVPHGKIFRAPEMLEDAQFKARESIVKVMHPQYGEVAMQNAFPRLSDTPGLVRWVGPELGQHTDEILKSVLGKTDEEIAALRTADVI